MQVTASYKNGVQFELTARGHSILCDQPRIFGGDDAGMTPPELLLASLASCAGYYAAEYLRFRNLPLEGLSVNVDAVKSTLPARLSSFHIEVSVPPLEERHREGVLRAVKKCLVHNTLTSLPEIEIAVAELALTAH